MNPLIVSDTTSLIVLKKLGQLSVLCDLFEKVMIPETVFQELLAGLDDKTKALDDSCMEVVTVKPSTRLDNLLTLLDAGEAEAIELALLQQCALIIDEKKGRQIARQMGVAMTGFIGLLILAVRQQAITADQAITMLEQAKQNGYHLSDRLYSQAMVALK